VTDIFEEVDQSLREDRFATWWKKYSLIVYGVIAAIIIGVGVFEFMRWQRAEEINREAKVFDAAFAATEKNDLPKARAEFAQLSEAKTGFGILAGHMLAGVEEKLTNDTAAIEAHLADAAAADNGVMGDLALLKLAYSKADTAKTADLEETLKPLLDKEGPASALAHELIAVKSLADGNVDRARELFEKLNLDLEAPQGMRERVTQALATLPARTVNLDAPAATPAPAAPAPAVAPAPAQPAPATPAPAKAPQ
jgi:hypothetical protein